MMHKLPNLAAPITMTLLAVIAVLDAFIPEEDPKRIFAIILQSVLLCMSLYYLFRTYVKKIKRTSLHTTLMIFITMIIVYGILTPNLRILPVVLYALAFFYLSYYLTFKGLLTLGHIQCLSLFLLAVYSYETYAGIFYRADRFGEFYSKADNVGYASLALMLMFALDLKKTRNIILFSFTFFLVIISFKRGAILAGSLVYLLALWSISTGRLTLGRNAKKYLIMIGLAATSILFYLTIKYWDFIAYRFISDETGGSGRELFWSEILRGWTQADLLNKIFGFGLFAVPEYLAGSRYGFAIYAHSDWYELLYDHGLVGIAIYLMVVISALMQKNMVFRYANEYYLVFLMTFAVWLPKSYYSGFYINKISILSMLVLGFIVGISNRQKQRTDLSIKYRAQL